MSSTIDFKKLQNHLKNMGFIFPSSEIYGGLANTYDYGPLGVMFIKKIKDFWWQEFITKEPKNYGIDVKTLLNPKVWQASGHINQFSDPLIENKINQKRYRADHIINEVAPDLNINTMTHQQMEQFLQKNVPYFDNSKTEWGAIRNFNLMFETSQGIIEGQKNSIFLRPELAQGIFINFKNVMKTMRVKVPFGIGQIGHSFRNEVTPRHYTFRTREFEQMELEYFVNPQFADMAFEFYKNKIRQFLIDLGMKTSSFRFREHSPEELAHYSQRTVDVEYKFPFGWGEIIGLANRGDYDLKAHMQSSGTNLEVIDETTQERFIPFVIEPSIGVDRLALALLVDSYQEIQTENNEHAILHLNSQIAPYKLAILPLKKSIHQQKATEVFNFIKSHVIDVTFIESSASIGKRYLYQDSIGTPWCVTIDDETLKSDIVTLRNRDTKEQIKISYQKVFKYL